MIRALLVAAAAFAATAGAASAAGLAERFPSGTALYVEWSGLSAQREKLAKTAWGEFLADPEVMKFTDGELPRVWGQIKRLAGGGLPPGLLDLNLSGLSALRDRPMAFGLIGLDVRDGGMPEPQAALVIHAGAGPERRALAEWIKFIEASALPGPVKERAAGVKVLPLPQGIPLTWGFNGDLFALTVGSRAADLFFGAPAKFVPLTADPAYAQLNKGVRYDGAAAAFYFNTDPLFKDWLPKLKPLLGERAAIAEKWLAEEMNLGPAGVQAAGATLCVEDRGFRERSLVLAAPGALGPKRPLITDADLKAIPVDAGFFSIMKFDPLAGYDQLITALRRISERNGAGQQFEMGLKGLQDNLGVDFRKDIVAALGDTVVVHGGPVQFPFLGGFTLQVAVKDPAKLRASLDRLGRGLNTLLEPVFSDSRWKTKVGVVERDGLKIHYLPLIVVSPAAAVTDTRLVVTLFPQSTGDAVRRLADPKAPSIADDPAFRKATAGIKDVVELSYSDSAGGSDLMWSLGTMTARFASGFLPNAQIDFDSATIPPQGLWKSRSFPTVGFTRVDGGATYSETYRPTPWGDSAAVLAVVVGVAAVGGSVAYYESRQAAARRFRDDRRFDDDGPAVKRAVPFDDEKPAPKRRFDDDEPKSFKKEEFRPKDGFPTKDAPSKDAPRR